MSEEMDSGSLSPSNSAQFLRMFSPRTEASTFNNVLYDNYSHRSIRKRGGKLGVFLPLKCGDYVMSCVKFAAAFLPQTTFHVDLTRAERAKKAVCVQY